MKTASKILPVVLLLLGLALPLARRAYAMAQVTMVNRTNSELWGSDLIIEL